MKRLRRRRKVLHLISQAHLDPVWLWPRRDGMAETLTTFQSAVERLLEFPEFKFTRSSSLSYEWVKEADPALFARIGELVRAGRWEVVGGWFEQPDCNLPSAESFLSQAEEGRRFFEKEFGAEALTPCGYNVDSFGHCGGLPQLLRAAGLEAYAFMRPEPWTGTRLPLLFWWEAPNGDRVLAIRIPGNYSQSPAAAPDEIERLIRLAIKENFAPGFAHGVMWFGVGNHGGGPTCEHIRAVLKMQRELAREPGVPEIRFSTLREFLAAVREEAPALPVVRGELGYVFRGCYSANGEIKRLHRLAEKKLFAAEAALAITNRGDAGQLRALQDARRQLLFLQFHDLLAGTCVASEQQEILSRYGSVLSPANDVLESEALRLARSVHTAERRGNYLFVLNPLPWPRRALIHCDTFQRIHGREDITELEDPDGRRLPIQWLPGESNFGPWGLSWGKLTAVADLPAGGYKVFRLCTKRIAERKKSQAVPASPPDHAPANSWDRAETRENALRQSLQTGAALESLTLPGAGQGRELLAGAVRFVVVRDERGAWGHGYPSFTEKLGEPRSLGHQVIAHGPLVFRRREVFVWERSEIWLEATWLAGSSDVELRVHFNWQERRQQLRLEIPTRLQTTRLLAKMPVEVAERPADGSEFPCHDWAALLGKLGHRAVSLVVLNDSTYGHAAQDGVISFPLARSAPFAEHPPYFYWDSRFVPFLDQGWQTRRFLLRVQLGLPSPAALDRAAEEFQIPPVVLMDSSHRGERPLQASLLEVRGEGMVVSSVRPSISNSMLAIRFRLFNTLSKTRRATVDWQGCRSHIALGPHGLGTLQLTAQDVPKQTASLQSKISPSRSRRAAL